MIFPTGRFLDGSTLIFLLDTVALLALHLGSSVGETVQWSRPTVCSLLLCQIDRSEAKRRFLRTWFRAMKLELWSQRYCSLEDLTIT